MRVPAEHQPPLVAAQQMPALRIVREQQHRIVLLAHRLHAELRRLVPLVPVAQSHDAQRRPGRRLPVHRLVAQQPHSRRREHALHLLLLLVVVIA